MVVVIDDERAFRCKEKIKYLRTSQETMLWFSEYVVKFHSSPVGSLSAISQIWFDYNLGANSNQDGLFVAKYIFLMTEAFPLVFWGTQFLIHAEDSVGAKRIKDVFLLSNITPYIVSVPN